MDISQIKFIKAKIALLDEEKKQLIIKLKSIEETNSQARISSPLYTTSRPVFPKENMPAFEQQIKLFRSLFHGRDDVYARLWISRKTGKSGYSPVCKNEWVRKICQKPLIKCSECPNRELTSLNDEMILKHLKGDCAALRNPTLLIRLIQH